MGLEVPFMYTVVISLSQKTHFNTILHIRVVHLKCLQTLPSLFQGIYFTTTLLAVEVVFMRMQTTPSHSQKTHFRTTLLIRMGVLLILTQATPSHCQKTFQDNSADYGGALYSYINNTLTLSVNTFQGNSADKNGGALNTNIGNIYPHTLREHISE